jgi:hypothetical protein
MSDVDRGLAALAQRLAGKARVRVGVLSDEPKASGDGNDSAMTLLDVAARNEFGAPAAGVPQRSFIRATVDQEQARIRAMQSSQATRIISGDTTPEIALEQIGAVVQGSIQARIARGIDPPNAPSTVARKGSSKPLVDTGQLRSSITYVVEEG